MRRRRCRTARSRHPRREHDGGHLPLVSGDARSVSASSGRRAAPRPRSLGGDARSAFRGCPAAAGRPKAALPPRGDARSAFRGRHTRSRCRSGRARP
jgi:hypothetical protein